MVSVRRVTVFLLVVGVLLATNALWFFPSEGATEFTYERSAVVVENGTLTYSGDHRHDATHRYHYRNDLVPVACQYADHVGRACALDAYLTDHDSITVHGDLYTAESRQYTRVRGSYYERIWQDGEPGGSYDVERVVPTELLAAVARDVSDVAPDELSDRVRLPVRIAVTGDAVTTTVELARADLGHVYARNDTYYTVVLTDAATLDRPVVPAADHRSVPTLAGVLLLLAVGLRVVDENQ